MKNKLNNAEKKYQELVNLYEQQVNLSHRTSESVRLQQFSTPIPIAYLMGIYIGANKEGVFFDPSAGNGNLTVAGKPENFIVNEIDPTRNRLLKTQGFKEVWNKDASQPFVDYFKKFDAIVTNPPFGTVDKVMYDKSPITSLEQLMALRSLDTMRDDGKAAIIIGGHQEFDEAGRIKSGKNRIFFVYLYKNYEIADIINIDSSKLYYKMGTQFNIRIILISGRKSEPGGFPPLITEKTDMEKTNSFVPIDNFSSLFERIKKLL